jgi:all-trans-retinol dehydrogenase (NAD+)
MTDLAKKNVLITGAASGIGRLMAERMSALGARLILWDIEEEGLGALASELRGAGGEVSCYGCDLSSRDEIRETAAKVLTERGPVDVLVNNAGVVVGKAFLEETEEEIERTLAINALAPIWTTRAFLPAMVEGNGGHLVTISSAAGIVGTARLVDYSASKFAAFGFDDSLRIDLRRRGIEVRTTVVCPYYIGTGMFEGVKTRFRWLLPILDPEKVADRVVRAIVKNRRRVVMPRFVYVAWPLRLLPVPIFDYLNDLFGLSHSMDEFKGRRR